MFINDLPLCFKHCSSDLYADDTTVHSKDSNVKNIENNMICDFKNAIEWSKPNKMQLHYGKTTCMLVGWLVGWLVGCFGFNGPLRQYFSLYRAVSQREGERGEKG